MRSSLTVLFCLSTLGLLGGLGCKGSGGNAVQVGDPNLPALQSLVATPAEIYVGQSATLTPQFSNAIGTIQPGNLSATPGVPIAVTPPLGVTTYTLTVTGPAGTILTQQATVTVNPYPQATLVAQNNPVTNGGTINCLASMPAGATATVTGYTGPVANGQTIAIPANATGTSQVVPMFVNFGNSQTETVQATVTLVPAPQAISLVPASATVTSGNATTLTPTFSGGVASIYAPGGTTLATNVVLGGSIPTGALMASGTYTLIVVDPAGDQASVTTTIQVVPPVIAPTVAPITPATPEVNVNQVQTFTSGVTMATNTGLTWTVSAGAITAGQGGNTITWTAPATPQKVTVTATAKADNVTAQTATATVIALPVASSLVPSTTSPLFGATVTITPSFSLGLGEIGTTGAGSNNIAGTTTTGTGISAPAVTSAKTYTLTVVNALGTQATTSCVVVPQAVVVSPVAPAAPSKVANSLTTFTATASGGVLGTVTWSASNGTINASTGTWTAPASGTATITATSNDDPTKAASTTVTVIAFPVASALTSSPTSPLNGATVTLYPNFSGGTASLGTTGPGSSDLAANVTSGTGVATPALSSPVTYTMTVTNSVGTQATSQCLVIPQTVVLTPIFPATVALTSGYIQTFSSNLSGASNPTLTWSVGGVVGGNAALGTITNWGQYTAGSTVAPQTITVTAAANGATQSAVATVYAAPVITNFVAAPSSPLNGANTVLTGTFSGGTGSISSLGAATSGTGYPTPTLTTTQFYTLTVVNLPGQTAVANVTVSPQVVTLAAITPSSVNLTTGYTQSFSSSVTGATNNALTWSVNGVPGGNGSVGTISASGLYSAGSTTGPQTITAMATATGATQNATANVYALPAITGFVAAPASPLSGANVVLTATFSGGSGFVSNSVGTVTSGAGANAGAIATAQTYLLTVTSVPGQTATSSLTVTPQVIVVGAITPSLPMTTTGTATTFSASVTGGLLGTVNWSVTGGSINPSTGAWTAPGTPGSVTITATSTDNSAKTATATVSVVAAPTGTLVPSTTSPNAGATITLLPTFTGVSAVIGTTSGGSEVAASVTSGSLVTTPAVLGPTTYYLTITNAVGATGTVNSGLVTPLTYVVSAITPANPTLTAGVQMVFSATTSGGTNSTTVWSATGGSFPGADGTWIASGRMFAPSGMVIDPQGNLIVVDTLNSVLRKISPAGVVSYLSGTVGVSGSQDGYPPTALFNHPTGITMDGAGNFYVADTGNSTIRQVTSGGWVTTIAGHPGQAGAQDGAATSMATLNAPTGLVFDSLGNLYIADSGNDTIRVLAGGTVTLYAGQTGTPGHAIGSLLQATFNAPWALAVDASNNLYVADSANDLIRKITATGTVSTLSGQATVAGILDGPATSATFSNPQGVGVDINGNVYVADFGSNLIREVTALGAVTTIAGQGNVPGFMDGAALNATFEQPSGLFLDSLGNVYVADGGNNTIRELISGMVSTFAGVVGTLPTPVTITASAQADPAISTTTTATVIMAPAFTQLAVPSQATVTPGGSVTFTPHFAFGTATMDNGVGPLTSGVQVTLGPLLTTTTFSITLVNAAGTTVTMPLVVTVQ